MAAMVANTSRKSDASWRRLLLVVGPCVVAASISIAGRGATPQKVFANGGAERLSVGGASICAVTPSGGVKCWGQNGNGELGIGTNTGPEQCSNGPNYTWACSTTPVDVSGLTSGVVSVSVGGNQTCVVTTQGGIKCWGENSSGQLGDGTTDNRFAPVDVSGLTSGVLAVSGDSYHTCALTTKGGVKCWGDNYYGELGDGTTTTRLTPVDVVGLASGVVALSAGGEHTCAITVGGSLKCWGRNYDGEIGDGRHCGYLICRTPSPVTGLSDNVVGVSAGSSYTCAVVNAGGVKCWGGNYYGVLGDGTTTRRDTPVDVSGLSGGVAAIAAGANACALTTEGGVKCWGANWGGNLGGSQVCAVDMCTSPVDLPGLTSGVVAITRGTCVLMADGGVRCSGNGSIWPEQDEPIAVPGLSSGVSAAAVGGSHACAIISGNLKCWGWNFYGQIGAGIYAIQARPLDVTGLPSGLGAISASGDHTCALTSTGGVKCWGRNNYGQLGDGTLTDRSGPVDVSGLTSGVAAISAGGEQTCALTDTGGAKCWGRNYFGQLGDGRVCGTDTCPTPVDVSGLSSGVLAVSSGGRHTCALTTGGGLKCWGRNNNGQLGDDQACGTGSCATPVDVSGLGSGVSSVSAGGDHTCAVTAGSNVYCWGSNLYGQIGVGTYWGSAYCGGTLSCYPTPVSVLGSATAVSAGVDHTCAVTTGGGVKCWGRYGFGKLGSGWGTAAEQCPVGSYNQACITSPHNVAGLSTGVLDVSAGGDQTCATTTSGGVKCWGDDRYGQLGDGTDWITAVPGLASTCTDLDGDTVCDSFDSDLDDDGCSNERELGANRLLGGQRNPKNFWDYFDTPNTSNVRDHIIRVDDVTRVVNRYRANDNNGTATINRSSDPLAPPPPPPAYSPAFDRTVLGPHTWNLGPPDGQINVADVVAVVNQYRNDCV